MWWEHNIFVYFQSERSQHFEDFHKLQSSREKRKSILSRDLLSEDTNSKERCPSWEANSFSVRHKFPNVLWKPLVLYHAQNSPPLVPVLNPVYILPPYFLQIHFNIIIPSARWLPKWSVFFRLFINTIYARLTCATRLLSLPSISSF